MQKETDLHIRRCIYCLEEKNFSATSPKQSDFNKEHVLHAAFANFRSAPMLVGRVCSKCNQLFGDTIDLELGRGGFEALLRLIKEQKEPAGHKQLKHKNYEFIANPEDSRDSQAGLKVQLGVKDNKLGYVPALQIGFLNTETNSWEWFSADEYLKLEEFSRPDLNFNNYHIYGPTEEEQQKLFDKVKEKNPDAKIENYIEGKQMPIDSTCITNKAGMRAIAKIAFNYMAYVTESISPVIAFLPDFHHTREFIRYGTGQGPNFVLSRSMPLLQGETETKAFTDSHLVTLDFARIYDRRRIVSDVALFNYIGWEVTLAKDYRGLEYPLSSIHMWDWRNRNFQKQVGLKADGTVSNWIS